jgi:hypothetical protein
VTDLVNAHMDILREKLTLGRGWPSIGTPEEADAWAAEHPEWQARERAARQALRAFVSGQLETPPRRRQPRRNEPAPPTSL